jgi:hypothetical protein
MTPPSHRMYQFLNVAGLNPKKVWTGCPSNWRITINYPHHYWPTSDSTKIKYFR